MTVIGYRKSNFKGERGEMVSGMNIYVAYPIEAEKGAGQGCDRLYMSVERLLNCGYSPSVGDEVRVEYNKYGKPAGIYLQG